VLAWAARQHAHKVVVVACEGMVIGLCHSTRAAVACYMHECLVHGCEGSNPAGSPALVQHILGAPNCSRSLLRIVAPLMCVLASECEM
jgi:hypothetical protein